MRIWFYRRIDTKTCAKIIHEKDAVGFILDLSESQVDDLNSKICQ